MEQSQGRCKYDLCISAPWLITMHFKKGGGGDKKNQTDWPRVGQRKYLLGNQVWDKGQLSS